MRDMSQSTVPIRLLALDVDGTLVGVQRGISPRVFRALKEVQQCGVRIVLSTGRPGFTVRQFIAELGLTGYHIFDSGASVSDPADGTILYQKGLARPLALEFLQAGTEVGLHLEVYADGKYFVEAEREHSRVHAEILRQEPNVAPLREVIEQWPVTKMEVVTLSDSERERTRRLAARFTDQIDTGWAGAPGSVADFVNILAKGVSKGDALARLAEHYSIPAGQIMAAGDGLNDGLMLQFAGIGIAMGDGPDALKEIATWVAPSVTEDGLALAVERFILDRADQF